MAMCSADRASDNKGFGVESVEFGSIAASSGRGWLMVLNLNLVGDFLARSTASRAASRLMIDEQYGNCPPLLSLKYPPRRLGVTRPGREAGREKGSALGASRNKCPGPDL